MPGFDAFPARRGARLAIRAGLALALLLACATSPLGRRQLLIFSEEQMAEMGRASFQTLREQIPESRQTSQNRLVKCVANAIVEVVDDPGAPDSWEVVVFEERSPNAFALPGGKIGVHTGLLQVARNQHQLAAVLGHEVAHVLAQHGNERVSQAYATQSALELAQAASGEPSPMQEQLFGLLGAGAQYGIILPFSRAHESEADLLGLDLMARAGFDPRESIRLWENMAALGGERPPEWASTHPGHETRIRQLGERVPAALELQQRALAEGRRPGCG